METCFLCSQYLGRYHITVAGRKSYLEALRLINSPHGLHEPQSPQQRLYEKSRPSKLRMIHSSGLDNNDQRRNLVTVDLDVWPYKGLVYNRSLGTTD